MPELTPEQMQARIIGLEAEVADLNTALDELKEREGATRAIANQAFDEAMHAQRGLDGDGEIERLVDVYIRNHAGNQLRRIDAALDRLNIERATIPAMVRREVQHAAEDLYEEADVPAQAEPEQGIRARDLFAREEVPMFRIQDEQVVREPQAPTPWPPEMAQGDIRVALARLGFRMDNITPVQEETP